MKQEAWELVIIFFHRTAEEQVLSLEDIQYLLIDV